MFDYSGGTGAQQFISRHVLWLFDHDERTATSNHFMFKFATIRLTAKRFEELPEVCFQIGRCRIAHIEERPHTLVDYLEFLIFNGSVFRLQITLATRQAAIATAIKGDPLCRPARPSSRVCE